MAIIRSTFRTARRRLSWALPLFAMLTFAMSAIAGADEAERPRTKAKHYYRSYLGKKPPELTGADAHWVNQATQVTLEKLHGQVVWLEFNF